MMPESNQEGYRTLGWIINESEQGLFLVVADEEIQKEIAGIYRSGEVKIYDYKRHPGEYFFRDLQEWVLSFPQIRVFMVVNFHLAIQSDESLTRLNFSRDMIERLETNIIFFVTPYGDDKLDTGAYDFYSYIKIRITFQSYKIKRENGEQLLLSADDSAIKGEWSPEKMKQKMAEAYDLTEQATDERNHGHYHESEKLLLKAQKIKEKLLGPEHLEMAEIYHDLALVYAVQGKYKGAEELYKKSLRIKESVLGEEHPDTAAGYNNLALVYQHQEKYKEAEKLYRKSLKICERILGEEHPDTMKCYNNLAVLYGNQGKYEEAKVLYEKNLEISKKTLGEEHPDTAVDYHNLAVLYAQQEYFEQAEALLKKSIKINEKMLGEEHPNTVRDYIDLAEVCAEQEKYEIAMDYYLKAYHIYLFSLGRNRFDTQVVYQKMKTVYLEWEPEGDFEQWLEENRKEQS